LLVHQREYLDLVLQSFEINSSEISGMFKFYSNKA
jgi:hypothetical protein